MSFISAQWKTDLQGKLFDGRRTRVIMEGGDFFCNTSVELEMSISTLSSKLGIQVLTQAILTEYTFSKSYD